VPSFDIRTMRDTQPGEVILTIRLARAASVVRLHAPLESVTPLEQLEDVTVIRVPVPDYPVVVEIQR
jgi:hypothetical protein